MSGSTNRSASRLRDEPSLASFRHGGMTEMGEADSTDSQMRAILRHKSTKILPTYVKRAQKQIIEATKKRRSARTNGAVLSE